MKSDRAQSASFARAVCLAGILTAAAACTVATTPPTPPVPDGFTAACEGPELLLAKGLRPATPVDFVGFRVESTFPRPAQAPCPAPCSDAGGSDAGGSDAGGSDAGGGSAEAGATVAAWSASFTSDVRGTPCSGATDRPACEKKVAALRLLSSFCDGLAVVPKVRAPGEAAPTVPGNCGIRYLVYTRGDEVGAVYSVEETRAFLGVVDAPQEAFYLARLSGELFSCSSAPPASYATVTEGYDLVAGTSASGACVQRIVRVTKDGAVKLVKQEGC